MNERVESVLKQYGDHVLRLATTLLGIDPRHDERLRMAAEVCCDLQFEMSLDDVTSVLLVMVVRRGIFESAGMQTKTRVHVDVLESGLKKFVTDEDALASAEKLRAASERLLKRAREFHAPTIDRMVCASLVVHFRHAEPLERVLCALLDQTQPSNKRVYQKDVALCLGVQYPNKLSEQLGCYWRSFLNGASSYVRDAVNKEKRDMFIPDAIMCLVAGRAFNPLARVDSEIYLDELCLWYPEITRGVKAVIDTAKHTIANKSSSLKSVRQTLSGVVKALHGNAYPDCHPLDQVLLQDALEAVISKSA